MTGRRKGNGPRAVTPATEAKNVRSPKLTTRTSANDLAESSLFEISYRDRLWRFAWSDYNGQERLTVWQHYRDRETGIWKPCGGNCRCGAVRESPGFIVPLERFSELLAGLSAIHREDPPEGPMEAA